MRVVVHSAAIQDRNGAALVFDRIRQRFNWLELVWADGGYNARQVEHAVAAQPPVRVEIVKRPDGSSGFIVLPRRWVVERTFSSFDRNRRLAKDYENLADTLAASSPSPASNSPSGGSPGRRLSIGSEHDDAGRQLRHAPGPDPSPQPGPRPPKTFVGEVMRAAKAGHGGQAFGRSRSAAGRSTVGRGRRTTLSLASRSPSRRVVVMTRIVRHRGGRFRSVPLSKHVAYLRREGVTRDGADARMFDATS